MAVRKAVKNGRAFDVIVAGDLFVDLVMTGFPALPGLGEEAFATACSRDAGGGTTHTSCGMGKLGMRAAAFGAVGRGDIGWLRRRFEANHVDTSMLIEHPTEPTGLTVAISTPADRIFYTYYGANVVFPEYLARPETLQRLASARHVHFAYPVPPGPLAAIATALHAEAVTVSIDVGWQQRWLDDPASLAALSQVDWFLPNEHEAQRMSGEGTPEGILEWFRKRGAKGVVLKLGRLGSAVLLHGEVLRVPSIEVKVLDTTGAGDCFNAGFLYGVLSEMPMEECLRYANICGAVSTETAGGIASFPTAEKVRGIWAESSALYCSAKKRG
jgi:sugar/nucleoside kinase (ribokinase family)